MKRKRFAVEQITGILKQAELSTPIADICRQHGISEQSYYRWKKAYGGMEPSEAWELKQLLDENTKRWSICTPGSAWPSRWASTCEPRTSSRS